MSGRCHRVLRCSLVAAAAALCAFWPTAACAQGEFVYFSTDLGTVPYDQALTVLAFQGLVNRDAPRLYVNTKTLHPWYAEGGPEWWGNESDPVWLDIYGQRGYSSQSLTSVTDLFADQGFRSSVAGLVIYDPDQLACSTWIAMTAAGAENRLPVTPAVLASIPQLTTWWPSVLDLRPLLADKLSAYQWAIGRYLADSSGSVAYVIGHDFPYGDPGDISALDYAVAKRAFVFDLSLDESAYPEEAALADTIAGHLQPPAALWGWYWEPIYVDFASRRGDYAICSVLASNLSFHRQIPPASTWPLQQTSRSDLNQLELDPNTYYLADVFTDGDIPARLTRFFEAGKWFDPARGQVPMNWAVDPALADEFPALFEYFYATATANDCFIAGPSGAGYCHPSVMPNALDFAAFVAHCSALTSTGVAVMQDYDLSPEFWDPFLAVSGTQAAVQGIADQDLFFRGDHVPLFPWTFYWWWWDGENPATPAQIAADIVARMTQGPPPNFAILYDGQAQKPTIAKEVMDLLAAQGFQFLRLDEMNALARQIDHFFDVGIKYWAHDQVEACFEAGVVQGYSTTHYRPTLPVTRDQMAVYISRALVIPSGDAAIPGSEPPPTFSDVPADHWAYRWIEYAVSRNVVQGYPGGTYHPDEVVNRGQMAVYVARAVAGSDDAVPPDTDGATFTDVTETNEWGWCYRYVEYCAANAIVQGYAHHTYRPANAVTRDQMAVYVARAFELSL
jgi:hypothetical protein